MEVDAVNDLPYRGGRGGGGALRGFSQWEKLCTLSPYKLWRSNLWYYVVYSLLIDAYCTDHRLNMELDLQSLFRLHVTWCIQLYSLAETPQLSPTPRIWTHIRGHFWSAKGDDISLEPPAIYTVLNKYVSKFGMRQHSSLFYSLWCYPPRSWGNPPSFLPPPPVSLQKKRIAQIHAARIFEYFFPLITDRKNPKQTAANKEHAVLH
jgi:hypothetical protein